MSSSYFKNFPKIKYFNVLSTNISLRTAFIERLKLNASVFYPYIIEENETADGLATDYYGSPEYDWLIYLANNIIDPHTQWPKTYLQFESYIVKKYGSLEEAKSQILFYRKNPDVSYINYDGSGFTNVPTSAGEKVSNNDDIRITSQTYSLIQDQINYYPVYAYDYEEELNEQKRNIFLIDNQFKVSASKELEDLLGT
jgi:hypothetical protein